MENDVSVDVRTTCGDALSRSNVTQAEEHNSYRFASSSSLRTAICRDYDLPVFSVDGNDSLSMSNSRSSIEVSQSATELQEASLTGLDGSVGRGLQQVCYY